jgi:DNA-directed RNA polymerase
MVHDSFGCYAPMIPMLKQFTKEEFYEMHKEPLLETLKGEVEKQIGITLPTPPEGGCFNVSSVLEADYIFH